MPGALPPIAAVISFIDCINRNDVAGLERLMSADHELVVFDEAPVKGRSANIAAWRGYIGAFPDYIIYPSRMAERGGLVAVLGCTTGSHLGLPDDEERKMTLIWAAEVAEGLLNNWHLHDDNLKNRRRFYLDA
jgi:ketosteroid isomerase-like protein